MTYIRQLLPQTPTRGSARGPRWGTSVLQTPWLAPLAISLALLCPLWKCSGSAHATPMVSDESEVCRGRRIWSLTPGAINPCAGTGYVTHFSNTQHTEYNPSVWEHLLKCHTMQALHLKVFITWTTAKLCRIMTFNIQFICAFVHAFNIHCKHTTSTFMTM